MIITISQQHLLPCFFLPLQSLFPSFFLLQASNLRLSCTGLSLIFSASATRATIANRVRLNSRDATPNLANITLFSVALKLCFDYTTVSFTFFLPYSYSFSYSPSYHLSHFLCVHNLLYSHWLLMISHVNFANSPRHLFGLV